MNYFLWWQRLGRNLLVFLDNKFVVGVNLRWLLTPMFHDTSLLGRILSFTVRLSRILLGSVIIILAGVSITVWFLLLLPPGLITTSLIYLLKPLKNIFTPNLVKKARSDPRRLRQLLLALSEIKTLLARLEIAPAEFNNLILPLTLDSWLNLTGDNHPHSLFLAILKLNRWRFLLGQKAAAWENKMRRWEKTPFIWDSDYVIRPVGGVDRGQMGVTTPTLDQYSRDLTREAQKQAVAEIIGKETTIEQMVTILSRKDKHNVLIIGLPGSGKTTLVKGLAQEIVRGVGAKSLAFKRLVALDTGRLAAGAGDAEMALRMEKILSEIKMSENIILFVDEVHQLAMVNQDNPESSTIFRALEPVLNEGRFQFIGATTTENYRKYIEPNEAFSRLFEIVELPEATAATTEAILEYEAWKLERQNRLFITRNALSRTVELADRYLRDRVLPDKAVALLAEAVAEAETKNNRLITAQNLNQLVSLKAKIPVSAVTRDEAKILMNLEAKLHQRVIGQNEAVKAVTQAIKRARTQLANPNKPIASFLFAGPTGVGKTETAKAIAAEFFGSSRTMIRFDMSEYQTVDSVDRLVTALTEAVRRQPYTVLLLDEIEKANAKILNLFLQVLDDARLTDLSGKTADFSNTIIIATTNAKNPLKFFSPEWLNRYTALITFKSLTQKEVKQVVKLKLQQLSQALDKQELKIKFAPELPDRLAQMAFSRQWGGRQADRVINDRVANVIADKLLAGEIRPNQLYTFSL